MGNDAVARLDAEIARQEMRLAGLKDARGIIAGLGQPPDPEVRLLTGPKRGPRLRGDDEKKRVKRKSSGDAPPAGDFSHRCTINDVEIPCTEQEAAVLELLIDAGEAVVPQAAILPIYDGSRARWRRSLAGLRRRMAPSRSTVDSVIGKSGGYRLVEAD